MKLINIQIARGVAAILVVVHHLLLPQLQMVYKNSLFFDYIHLNPLGDFAVYFFFCISGFVMMFSCSRKKSTSAQFLLDRVFRIYPLYIICTVGAIVVYALTRNELSWLININYFPESYADYISSFLIIPPLWNGESFALPLATAWSLVYEMFFYLLFAFALSFISLRNIPFLLLGLFFSSFVVINSIYEPHRYRWVYWPYIISDFINICFAMGAAIFLVKKHVSFNSALSLASIIGVLIVIVLLPKIYMERVVLAVLACVCFFLLLHVKPFCGKIAYLFVYLGNASYSIYLTHVVFNSLSWKFVKISPVFGVGLTIFAIFFGCLIHEFLEKPIARTLTKLRY